MIPNDYLTTAKSYLFPLSAPGNQHSGISTLNALGCLTCLLCYCSCNSLFSLKFFSYFLLHYEYSTLSCGMVFGNRYQISEFPLSVQACHKQVHDRVLHLSSQPDWSCALFLSTEKPNQAASVTQLLTHLRRCSCNRCARRALPSQPVLLICKYAGGRFHC